jgi:KaiC/GvpD/RAD55 family RecA-like ATPase
VIENLSDFSNLKEEMADLSDLLRKAVQLIKNTEKKRNIIFIAALYDGIFPISFENQIKHLADSYFQFEMTKKYTEFERTLSIWKYKESNISGKILRYVLQDGKIQIENKKRIY